MSIMRTTLVALSKNKSLQDLIVQVPISRQMARRFVAGETLADAIAAVQSVNAQGMLATLDHLGENVATEAEAVAAADEYLVALDALCAAGVDCNVSVKLTQMGLDLGDDFCLANVSRIVRSAADCGNFVRVDMEGSPYTERTIGIYRRLRREFDNTGIVIQAYLHRSQADVEALIADGIGHFRLCKGAYDEPESLAYRERPRVTQALDELARTCLEPLSRDRDAYAAVASHDEEVDQLRAGLRLPARCPAVGLRIPDALRHPPRASGQAGAGRLSHARLRAVWDALVSLLYAPPGRAAGELVVFHARVGGELDWFAG